MAKDEHSSIDADPNYELNEKLDKMVEAGMAKTKEWVNFFQESLRYVFGDQLYDRKLHKDWDWLVINYIWPSAIQEIAKLSKNHPKIIANAWEDSDIEFAEVWQSILQWLWEKGLVRTGMRLEQIAAILDGKIFGYRVSKLYWEDNIKWDDENKVWLGDIRHKLWHPAHFWVSPEAEKVDEAQACGTYRYATLEWAQQRWPEFATELEQEAEEFAGEGTGGEGTIWGGRAYTSTTVQQTGKRDTLGKQVSPTPLVSLILGQDKMTSGTPKDRTKIVKIEDIYFKDYTSTDEKLIEDVPQEELEMAGAIYEKDGIFYDSKTQKPIKIANWPKRTTKKWKQPKYPNGRNVIRVGKTILNPDEKSQKYPHTRWPFIIIPHYLLAHMWQGTPAYALVKEVQDTINITASHLYNNMKLFGDPKIAVEDGAISVYPRTKKQYKIGSGAGAIIRLVKGAISTKRFQIIQPAQAPTMSFAMYNLLTQEYKNIHGLQSIARGEQQKKMTATEAHHLALSSVDRIALQSVYEDEWIKQICSLAAEICQANYDVGRFVRIVGEDKIVGIKQITGELKAVRFDVDVEPATTLPFDEEKRIAKYIQAYGLFGQPVANPMLPDILRILGIPNWKKLLAQHRPWVLWTQFLQLFESVKAGKIQPEQALQILTQRTMQEFAQDVRTNQTNIPAGRPEAARR